MVGSRFVLTNAPAMEPAEDIVTRSTVGPFVDLGVWIHPSPRRRRVYLTVETVRELAEVAGVGANARPADFEQQLAAARAEGALAVLQENLHGDLARVLVRLGHLLPESDSAAGVAADAYADEDGGDDDTSS